MIIDSSLVQLSAEHHKSESIQYSARLATFMVELDAARQRRQQPSIATQAVAGNPPTPSPKIAAENQPQATPQAFELIPTALSNRFRLGSAAALNTPAFSPEDNGINRLSASFRLFQSLFQVLVGQLHPIQQLSMPITAQNNSQTGVPFQAQTAAGQPGSPAPGLAPKGLAIEIQVVEHYQETECTQFSGCGLINTRDGRQIDFNLELKMSRSFESSQRLSTRQVVLKDPLVINFDGHSTELDDELFQFDLEADGEKDWIRFVDGNSGLLALDRNNDGLINDGSELFGVSSGNGFADLALFDQDSNGFIDEQDSVFEQLRIWTRNNGEDHLTSLKQRDIGALYLGATDTPFSLKDDHNQLQAKIQRSGIYLTESGEVGSLQQVDMVV